jgi:hypothetical protein
MILLALMFTATSVAPAFTHDQGGTGRTKSCVQHHYPDDSCGSYLVAVAFQIRFVSEPVVRGLEGLRGGSGGLG